MINLLPDEDKRQLKAARTNVSLLRYFGILSLALGFLAFTLIGSYTLLTQTQQGAKNLIEANDTKADVFSSTQQQITVLSGNLSGARAVLDSQVSYAKILQTIGQQMTSGTVLDSVTLTPETTNGVALTVTVYATTNEASADLRERFQSSPAFSSVNIVTSNSDDGIEGYPVSTSMTLSLTPEAGR